MGRTSYRDDVYRLEKQAFRHWAGWVGRSDAGTINRFCGLTIYGSIPTMMMQLPDFAETDGPVEYVQETKPAPGIGRQIQQFMDWLQPQHPECHAALVGRHLRLAAGTHYLYSSEARIAEAIYGLKRAHAHARLTADCELGYRLLAKWMQQPVDGANAA